MTNRKPYTFTDLKNIMALSKNISRLARDLKVAKDSTPINNAKVDNLAHKINLDIQRLTNIKRGI